MSILLPRQLQKAPRVAQTAEVSGLATTKPGTVAIAIIDVQSIDAPHLTPPPPQGMIVNYARSITYTVSVQLPSGGYVEVTGVKPSVPRWPHPMLVQAFQPLSDPDTQEPLYVYPGIICAGRVYFTFAEMPYYAPCPEGGG